jgi:biopolymer transport protein ExbD
MKLPAREDVSIDMAPMIDMVFLLLIFFMVASIMKTTKVPIKIPESKAAKVADNIKDRVTLSLNEQGQPFINLRGPVEFKDVTEYLDKQLDENPDTRVFIRADKDVTYKYTKKLIKACSAAGAMDLIYATFEE